MSFLCFYTTIQTTTELNQNNEESEVFDQLEALRAKSATTKQELDSYKQKAETLQVELLVR